MSIDDNEDLRHLANVQERLGFTATAELLRSSAEEADAMREALRRLGDLADAREEARQRCAELAREEADGEQQLKANARFFAANLSLAEAAQAARDLYAPKESGQ